MGYQRKDSYYRKAKDAGYRSRAAYKLLELNRRYRLMRPGDRVVDLGAWPGGWLQVAAEAVGPRGCVIGVDRVPLDPLPQAWVSVLFGDAGDEIVQTRVAAALGGPADVVLSDMAPKLSGVRPRDEEAARELFVLAVGVAGRLLRCGGRMAVKLFTSGAVRELTAMLENRFERVKTTRPEATRKGSPEVYAIGIGFRPLS